MWKRLNKADQVADNYWSVLPGFGIIKIIRNGTRFDKGHMHCSQKMVYETTLTCGINVVVHNLKGGGGGGA